MQETIKMGLAASPFAWPMNGRALVPLKDHEWSVAKESWAMGYQEALADIWENLRLKQGDPGYVEMAVALQAAATDLEEMLRYGD